MKKRIFILLVIIGMFLPNMVMAQAPVGGLSSLSGKWEGEETVEYLGDKTCETIPLGGHWSTNITVLDNGELRFQAFGTTYTGKIKPDMSVIIQDVMENDPACQISDQLNNDQSNYVFTGQIVPEGDTYRLIAKSDTIYLFCDFCPVRYTISIVKAVSYPVIEPTATVESVQIIEPTATVELAPIIEPTTVPISDVEKLSSEPTKPRRVEKVLPISGATSINYSYTWIYLLDILVGIVMLGSGLYWWYSDT